MESTIEIKKENEHYNCLALHNLKIITGDSCAHSKPVTMKMEDDSLATTGKHNAKVFTKHLHGGYNATYPRYVNDAELIKQRE